MLILSLIFKKLKKMKEEKVGVSKMEMKVKKKWIIKDK